MDAPKLDSKTRHPAENQIQPRYDSRRIIALAHRPEYAEDDHAFDKRIDRRRMHPDPRRIRDAGVGIDPADDRPCICHTPGHIGDLAPISIASDMTADAADTINRRKRRRPKVTPHQPWNLVFFDHPGSRDNAAQKTTVPGKSG